MDQRARYGRLLEKATNKFSMDKILRKDEVCRGLGWDKTRPISVFQGAFLTSPRWPPAIHLFEVIIAKFSHCVILRIALDQRS
jgi:hypothetical protein